MTVITNVPVADVRRDYDAIIADYIALWNDGERWVVAHGPNDGRYDRVRTNTEFVHVNIQGFKLRRRQLDAYPLEDMVPTHLAIRLLSRGRRMLPDLRALISGH